MTKAKTRITIDDRIRERLSRELQTGRQVESEQKLIDEILRNSVQRIEEYIQIITEELGKQHAAMGHTGELRSTQQDLAHRQRETAALAINLSDVFFRSDIHLLVKHINIADEKTIIEALMEDEDALNRLRGIIAQIDSSEN